ncbi:metal-sensitive transcriptional regulator [Stomatohabitans albus]|uniref:metal-sensitive transcriptional regulator n=1 Tax=Stomatohabitans albus TaxID=3110766 RepID=UPI00300C6306
MQLSQEDTKPSVTRLKRARGQLDAVIRMLEAGEDCEAVVTQLAAVAKAVDRAGCAIIVTGLRQCLEDPSDEFSPERLEKLFLSFA